MRKRLSIGCGIVALLVQGAFGQSLSSSTARHIGWGSALPATCSPTTGDVFFKTSATIGLYYCSATNTWSAVGGGTGTVTSVGLAGTANQITVTGATPITGSGSWTLSFPTNMTLPGTTTGTFSGNITGNVTGNASGSAGSVLAAGVTAGAFAAGAYTIPSGGSLAISGTGTIEATSGDSATSFFSTGALAKTVQQANTVYNDQANTWSTGAQVFTAASLRIPNSTTLPANCTVGDEYMDTNATTGQRFYLCESTDTWVVQSPASPVTVYSGTFGNPNSGIALSTPLTTYMRVKQACTVTAWNITSIPAGSATFTVWKVANGTTAPTVSNIINTLGLSISSATATARSTTVSDFTDTTWDAYDMIAIDVTATATSQFLQFNVECN